MIGYLAAMNVLAFFLMALDKHAARHAKRRIAERVLLSVAALGGSLGELFGMYLFHHKTKHPRFYITLPLLLAAQLLLLAWLYLR